MAGSGEHSEFHEATQRLMEEAGSNLAIETALVKVERNTDAVLELAAMICRGRSEMLETGGESGYQEWEKAASVLADREMREPVLEMLDATLAMVRNNDYRTLGLFVCEPDRIMDGVNCGAQALFQAVVLSVLYGAPGVAFKKVFREGDCDG